MLDVYDVIKKVASSDVPVLIHGESGTGKELVARAIYSTSSRKDNPFVTINVGAIPESLLEAELFGHEKGAFTGADSRIQGKVEFSHKGTLFLDEIGELPPNLQVKLLRFLQEKTLQRIGGRWDVHVDARIIAATNIHIGKAMEQGSFRRDLYYRIGVITIMLPSLRERGEDINILANYFLHKFTLLFDKKINGFSDPAQEMLNSYEWPGNVRELENKISRAVIMSESSIIELNDLGFDNGEPDISNVLRPLESMSLKEARNKVEEYLVGRAIDKSKGNVASAAKKLGISRPSLYHFMKKYGYQNNALSS